MVCWLYYIDNRELSKGRNSYVHSFYIANRGLILMKCGKGFVAFDKFKSLLQDENGKISGPKTVIAGFGAGFTESLLAVTPFESIKTQL